MKIANGMEFINDEDVIGKWHLIGWSNKADHDSIYDLNEGNNGYSDLYFLPDGQPYWIFEGWTKGFLLIHHGGDAPILTYTYKISIVEGKKYLLLHKDKITSVINEKINNMKVSE